MGNATRAVRRDRRRLRIRKKIRGTAQRPRLCVYRSLRHIYAQVVDDASGQTLASASSVKLGGKKVAYGGNIETAKKVGQAVAEQAREKGIESVLFDRGGCLYHGRVKALAEAAREAGLKF